MKRVVLHIDSLVLDGFPAQDRQAIADSLRAELGRRFAAAQAEVSPGRAADRLDAGRILLPAHSPPAVVGTRAAAAVARSLLP